MKLELLSEPIVAPRKLALVVSGVVLIAFLSMTTVGAQSIEKIWSDPVNLSRSGTADQPNVVIDSNGTTHVIWQDLADEWFIYTRYANDEWNSPGPVEFPFGTRRFLVDLPAIAPTPLFSPVLVPDEVGGIHSIWIDSDSRLVHSRVNADNFANFDDWSPIIPLAESAIGADLAVDDSGDLHLLYIRLSQNQSIPSGVYYRQSQDSGLTWSAPILLFDSPYYRSQSPSETRLSITTQGSDRVYAGWDNLPLERVYASQSLDGGLSWSNFEEVDRRLEDDGLNSIGPSKILISASGEEVHRLWQAGHQGSNCDQYHQFSTDGGLSWQPPQPILESINNCPRVSQLISGVGAPVMLISETDSTIYFSIWSDDHWSEPTPQLDLSSFVNVDTFRMVDFGCLQPIIDHSDSESIGNQLLIVGCDTSAGQDIWFRSQPVDSILNQLSDPEVMLWSSPEEVGSTTSQIASLSVVSDSDGQLHALWNQTGESDQAPKVYYSRRDDFNWTTPIQILTSLDGTGEFDPTVVMDPAGRLLVAWSSGSPGRLFFSKATGARAGSSTDWSTGVPIPVPRPSAGSPDLAVDHTGRIYVVYSLPLNEERGIYLAHSDDGGDSWQGPQRIFDGVGKDWDMVGPPKLALGSDGVMHLLWTNNHTLPDGQPINLFYSRSEDWGASWTEPEVVSPNPAIWYDVYSVGDRIVHRMWQDSVGSVLHQESIDRGFTWSRALRLTGLIRGPGPAAVSIDSAGRPIAVQSSNEQTSPDDVASNVNSKIQYWSWTNGNWELGDELEIDLSGEGIENLAATVSSSGILSVIYSSKSSDTLSGLPEAIIQFAETQVDVPFVTPTPLPPLTPTPTIIPTGTPISVPTPTATPVFPLTQDQGSGLALPFGSGNSFTWMLLGIVPAVLLVIVAFLIGVRMLRSDR